jgi:hypothetical protein
MNHFDHISRISDTTALLARYDEFPAGCDADFDSDFEELERQFAELRLTFIDAEDFGGKGV